MKNRVSRLKIFVPYIIMGVLFLLSSIPQSNMPKFQFQHMDKLQHFIAYMVLSFAWYIGLKESGFSATKAILLAVVFSASFGVFEEYHQEYFAKGRVWDAYDIVADFVGASAAGLFIYLKRSRYVEDLDVELG